ncbi:MAG: phosphatidylserine decarboxylase family protein [Saprospiraceae bacterium]
MFIRLHREGFAILIAVSLFLLLLNVALRLLGSLYFWPVLVLSLIIFGLVAQFFRNPVRIIPVKDDHLVYAPADGRICVIEEVFEGEYFKDKRLQVSIFMSPLNVHVNRNPVGGTVSYFRYHAGKYLVAWHPKSSTENERTSVVYDTGDGKILMRQIAGAVAKRIKWYVNEGDRVEQGKEMGFIKFGSRVDLFLPINTKIEVAMNQHVSGNLDVLAKLPN